MSTVKFEFYAKSALVSGTVDYRTHRNQYHSNDPRAEASLKVDYNSIEIKDIVFNDEYELIKNIANTLDQECKNSSVFKQGFGVGILNNNLEEFKKQIEEQIYSNGNWEDA